MNVIKIMGGLGNQLFQYAFGKAQAQNGIDVSYDTSFYGSDKKKPTLRYRNDKWTRYYRLSKFKTNVSLSPFLKQPTIRETMYVYDSSLLHKKNYNFEGYWQFPRYYDSVLPLMRQDFCVKEEYYTEEYLRLKSAIENTQSVGVHVRRGDYVLQKGFHDLFFDYYLRAIRHTKGDLFIFSDDVPWCKNRFKQDYFSRKITFIRLEDYLDFELLRLCKQKVIANSTFSWWAAFLGEENQVVVAPSGWIIGARELNQFDKMEEADKIYYPTHWIKI